MIAAWIGWIGCSGQGPTPAEGPADEGKEADAAGSPSTAATSGANKRSKRGKKAPRGKLPGMDRKKVEIFWLNDEAFAAGTQPYLVAVEREVPSAKAEGAALEALFAGPSPGEVVQGLSFVASGASGFSSLAIANKVATVKLKGGCDAGGSTFTVYDHIRATLTAFDSVDSVKVLGPDDDDNAGEPIPTCLQP